MIALRILACLSIVLLARSAGAQQTPLARWHHTAWTGEAGPPIPGEHLMVRSPDGYLWLSAVNALLRFDGVRFTRLDSSTTPELRSPLSGEFVPSVIDSAGAMWVRGPGGAWLTYRDGRFQRVRAGAVGADGVLRQDAHGLLWISGGRLYRVRGSSLVPAGLPAGVPDTGIFGVVRDTGSGLWIGTEAQGLWHVNGNSVKRYGKGRLRALLHASDGTVWALGVGMGLGIWRLKDSVFTRATLAGVADDRLIARIAVERMDGSIWFQTPGMGVFRWHNGIMERFSTAEGLSNNRTHDVYADAGGAVWISTDGGIDRLRPSTFVALSTTNDLPYDAGYEIEVDRRGGGLWGASLGSRLLYLLDGGAIRREPDPIRWTTFDIDSGRPFRVLAPSNGGGVWVAPRSGGLVLQDVGSQRRWRERDGMPASPILRALEARDGTLWMSDSAGGFGRLRDKRYAAVKAAGSRVRRMAEDAVGRLWVWGEGWPELRALVGDSVVQRVNAPSTVGGLAWERGDTVWAITSTSVMRLTSTASSTVELPGLKEILGTGAALSITREYLWIANARGIARVALQDLHRAADGDSDLVETQRMDHLDGLPFPRMPTLTPESMRTDADGRLWVVIPSGIFVSEEAPEPSHPAPPQVHIEELLVSEQVLPRRDSYVIAPRPERLTIRFSAPNLLLPERTRVAYRLDGADGQWVPAPPERSVTYTLLRPGNYTFRVRAWNEAGVSAEREATMMFRVLPSWYQSWWFRGFALLVIAGSAVVGGAAWLRLRNRRNQERLQARFEAVLAERARIARELHDTLLQGFTGITLHLEALRTTVEGHSDTAAKELAGILRTADSTLREAREMVWDMRSPQLDTIDVVTALDTTSRQVFNGDNVSVRYQVQGTPRPLPASAQTTVLRVGREALFNAMKHGRPKSIDVLVSYLPRQVVLEVRDDGQGVDPQVLASAESLGHFGVAGMRERAQRSGGEVSIMTSPGKGFALRMTLPAEPID